MRASTAVRAHNPQPQAQARSGLCNAQLPMRHGPAGSGRRCPIRYHRRLAALCAFVIINPFTPLRALSLANVNMHACVSRTFSVRDHPSDVYALLPMHAHHGVLGLEAPAIQPL